MRVILPFYFQSICSLERRSSHFKGRMAVARDCLFTALVTVACVLAAVQRCRRIFTADGGKAAG